MGRIDHLTRRRVLQGIGAGLLASGCAASRTPSQLQSSLLALELENGGRLGVAVIGVGNDNDSVAGYRMNTRFGLCSTFKLPLVAYVLLEADRGNLDLQETVTFGRADLVAYAPVTEQFLDRGYMSIEELAAAAQKTSDNVAANLLLRRLGGPAAFTQGLRSLGDSTTRLDRWETELNFVPHGEVRDTTTPSAMARTTARFLSRDLLSENSRERLVRWMIDTRTGLRRLRAGFPPQWRSGDKTGTGIVSGMPNRYNDVAAVWPSGNGDGFVIAAYYEADGHYADMRDRDEAVLRAAGAISADHIARLTGRA